MREDAHRTLVEKATRGDREALETLLERHLPTLLAYVRLHAGPLLRRMESSADLAQTVCRKVLGDLDGFEYRGEPEFRKWLFAKALSKLRDRERYYRAEQRDAARRESRSDPGTLPEGGGIRPSFCSPSEAAIREEEMRSLETAFEQLPDDYRQVITLARLIELPQAEVAAEMGRSEGAVRVLLHRALVRLGLVMSQRNPGSSPTTGPP